MPMGANDVYYCDECGRAIYVGDDMYSHEITGGRADYGGDGGGRAKAFCSEACLERAKARILGYAPESAGESTASSGRVYRSGNPREFKKALEGATRAMDGICDTIGLTSDKNKWVAFVLCFFFGFLGAHQFYAGHVKKGFLYMFTGALFTIGWFKDLFLILSNRFRDSHHHLIK